MSDFRGISGTPWHVERFTRAEGDDRRHRSRCKYYHKEDSYCSKELGRCRGAAHCKYYKESLQKDDKGSPQVSSSQSSPSTQSIQEPVEPKKELVKEPVSNQQSVKQGLLIKNQESITQRKEKSLNTGYKRINAEQPKTPQSGDNVSVPTVVPQNVEVKGDPADKPIYKIGALVQDREMGSGVVCEVKGRMIRVFYTRDGIAKWIDSYSCAYQKPSSSQPENTTDTVPSKSESSVTNENTSEEPAFVKIGIKVHDRKLGLGVVRAVNGKMIQVYFERDGITKWIDSYFCIRQKTSSVGNQSVGKPASTLESKHEVPKEAHLDDSSSVKTGAKIMDKKLGIGTVREVNGQMIWVYFENYQITKLLDSRFCQFVDTKNLIGNEVNDNIEQ